MQRSEETNHRRSNGRTDFRERPSGVRTARTDSARRLEPEVQLEEPMTTWLSVSFGIELG